MVGVGPHALGRYVGSTFCEARARLQFAGATGGSDSVRRRIPRLRKKPSAQAKPPPRWQARAFDHAIEEAEFAVALAAAFRRRSVAADLSCTSIAARCGLTAAELAPEQARVAAYARFLTLYPPCTKHDIERAAPSSAP